MHPLVECGIRKNFNYGIRNPQRGIQNPRLSQFVLLRMILVLCSSRKQMTFSGATTGFPAKWRPRNEHRNSILMTCHLPDLVSASDWMR